MLQQIAVSFTGWPNTLAMAWAGRLHNILDYLSVLPDGALAEPKSTQILKINVVQSYRGSGVSSIYNPHGELVGFTLHVPKLTEEYLNSAASTHCIVRVLERLYTNVDPDYSVNSYVSRICDANTIARMLTKSPTGVLHTDLVFPVTLIRLVCAEIAGLYYFQISEGVNVPMVTVSYCDGSDNITIYIPLVTLPPKWSLLEEFEERFDPQLGAHKDSFPLTGNLSEDYVDLEKLLLTDPELKDLMKGAVINRELNK